MSLPHTCKCRICGHQMDGWEQARAALDAAPNDALVALRELVACKDLKDRGWAMRKADNYAIAEIRAVEREYAERKQKAWEAARFVLAQSRPAEGGT